MISDGFSSLLATECSQKSLVILRDIEEEAAVIGDSSMSDGEKRVDVSSVLDISSRTRVHPSCIAIRDDE